MGSYPGLSRGPLNVTMRVGMRRTQREQASEQEASEQRPHSTPGRRREGPEAKAAQSGAGVPLALAGFGDGKGPGSRSF